MVAGLSLHERLEQARRRQFVGRVGERDRLRAVLGEPELPFFVLHIFGPGGLGKTSLLREYGYIARELGIQSVLLDGRNFDASPVGFLGALGYALHLPAGGDPAASFSTPSSVSEPNAGTRDLNGCPFFVSSDQAAFSLSMVP